MAKMRWAFLALLLAGPAYAQTYEPQPVPPVIAGAPTNMTPLNLGDDSTVRLDLGFDFSYWDQIFSSAWVSSNGTISFGTSAHLCCNGLPLENAPRNTIYGFWTDLISRTGNPFFRRSDGSFLVGWYGTNEFGTNSLATFEINLFSNGDIRFNFGDLPMLRRMATIGITGPEVGDNIQLFYGRDPRAMQNQSWLLGWSAPVVQVDCGATPLDPSCPPQIVSPIALATAPGIVTPQEAEDEEAVVDEIELAVAQSVEPEQVIEVASAEEVTESVVEQVAEAIAAETAAVAVAAAVEPQAERLSPEQVAALAVNSPTQDSQPPIQEAPAFIALAGPTAQFAGGGQSGVGFVPQGPVAAFAGIQGAEAAIFGASIGSPSSVANSLEALSMSGGLFSAASGPSQAVDQQANQGDNPDAEKMEAMASVPGFSAYAQAAIRDRADFYAVRDIYKSRRITDANFEMYRMTQSNNAKWQEMVDVQYR